MKDKWIMNLSNLRKEVDKIDYKIIHLLNKRVKLARKIVDLKQKRGLGVYDPKRGKEITKKLKSLNLVRPSLIDKIWKALFEYYQKK